MSQIESVVLTSAELSSVNANIKCPQCFTTFKSSSNLNMHLSKHHQIPTAKLTKRSPGVEVRYHCPEVNCKYSSVSGMSFKRSSLLKQHYLKVHAAKEFVCEKCNKGFATQATKNYHAQTCGMSFVCSCGVNYTSREALLTHAKRKQHDVSNQTISAGKMHRPDGRKSLAEAFPIHFLAAVALSELSERSKPITREIGIQTETDVLDCRPKRKSISPVRNSSQSAVKLLGKRKASTQTQTLAPRKLKMSTETQTIGDIILRKAMQNANIPVRLNKRGTKKHSETQTLRKNQATKQNETQTSSLEPSSEPKSQELQNELKNANLTEIEMDIQFIESQTLINDASLPDVWLNQKSTQTTPTENPAPFFFANQFSIDNLLTAGDDKFQSSETQTELAAEYGSDNFLDDCDTNFTLCSNIETQTELNESIEEMLHSNMYTQTCDELLLDFVDIQTQTW